jgi:hypothetical protein
LAAEASEAEAAADTIPLQKKPDLTTTPESMARDRPDLTTGRLKAIQQEPELSD